MADKCDNRNSCHQHSFNAQFQKSQRKEQEKYSSSASPLLLNDSCSNKGLVLSKIFNTCQHKIHLGNHPNSNI